jgi:hypothetical protein
LFGTDIVAAILPEMLPDELLYSVVARWRDRMCVRDERAVLETLFGTRSATAVVELPGRIDAFLARVPPGHPYTADSLIERHTTLPYYSSFLPPERVRRIRGQLRTGGSGGVVDRSAFAPAL